MTKVADKLNLAWRLRFDQRNEESLALWCEVREELRIVRRPLSEADIQDYLNNDLAHLLIDGVLLQASLCRMQRQSAESNRILTLVASEFEKVGAPVPARYLIEKGLNYLMVGDYTNALESFLTASSRAKDNFQKLASLTNIISCYVELGVAYGQALKQAEDLLEIMDDKVGLVGARNLLQLTQSRQAFRDGDFDALFTTPLDFAAVNQNTYLKMWISALPYHHFQQNQHEQFELFSKGSTHLFLRAYRLRTLQAALHPDDVQNIKPSEWADRLYLWVWKWICDPEGFAIGRTVATLSRIKSDLDLFQHLSAEDKQLIRNALLWLSLFDRQSHSGLKDILSALKVPESSASALLSFEALLIHFLLAQRDGECLAASDYLQNLKSSPLWHSTSIYLAALARTVSGEANIHDLPDSLKTLAGVLLISVEKSTDTSSAFFYVDVAKGEIRDARTGRSLLSESIAKAILFLSENQNASTIEFTKICFGISRFDPTIHNQRIFNLLWRMKKCFSPTMTFKIKSGSVIAEGDWEKFSITGHDSATLLLQNQQEWRNLVLRTTGHPSKKSNPPKDAHALAIPNVLSRKEIEQHLGKSRATMNRVLKRWEKEGAVRREGHARATRYHLSRDIISILKGANL